MWSVDLAILMSKKIVERHGAVPYGFQFTTRERTEKDFDSREVAKSPFYYLGGEVFTLAQLKASGYSGNGILISNMECNHYDKVVINTNSYEWTAPLGKNDIVLDMTQEKHDKD
jgi:hypothetical protein